MFEIKSLNGIKGEDLNSKRSLLRLRVLFSLIHSLKEKNKQTNIWSIKMKSSSLPLTRIDMLSC